MSAAEQQTQQMKKQPGFIAALDKSGGSTPHALALYGIKDHSWTDAVIVAAVRRVTRLPLELHMMITGPDAFFDAFVAAGADSFLVHWEGNNDVHRTLRRVKELNKRVGVVINPATPAWNACVKRSARQ
jgi:ribulose-phosphate 3-epimerase